MGNITIASQYTLFGINDNRSQSTYGNLLNVQ